MNDRSSLPFWRARPTQRRARRGSFALPFLGLCAASVLAAGCAGIGSDPLLAASVYGHPISYAAFGQIVAISELASSQPSSSGPNPPISWQTPDGRPSLASLQSSALESLVGIVLVHQQVLAQHIPVSAKDVTARIQQFADSEDQNLHQNPSDPSLQQLDSGGHEALRQHLGNRDLYDLLAGRPSVADMITIVLRAQIEQQALEAHAKVPTVHIRVIETATLKSAQQLEQQVRHGSDFGQLARQHSLDQATASNGGEVGTFHVGELGIFNKNFDTQIFDPTVRHTQKVEYAIFPYNGKYELFEITQRSSGALADIKDTQVQSTVYDAWMAVVIRPAANVQEYAAIDATATTAPQGP
jgi:hypothetical protein